MSVYSNVKNKETITPGPDPDPSIKTFRLNAIAQIQKDLEQDLSKYNKTRRRYSSIFNTLSYINTGAGLASGSLSAVSVSLLTTGVGLPAAVPLGGVSVAFCTLALASSVLNKKIKSKLLKHTSIVQLATAKLSSFRLILSKAFDDSNITDEEFCRLQADFDDYKHQKFNLQKKLLDPVDTEKIKKQCLEEVNKTVWK